VLLWPWSNAPCEFSLPQWQKPESVDVRLSDVSICRLSIAVPQFPEMNTCKRKPLHGPFRARLGMERVGSRVRLDNTREHPIRYSSRRYLKKFSWRQRCEHATEPPRWHAGPSGWSPSASDRPAFLSDELPDGVDSCAVRGSGRVDHGEDIPPAYRPAWLVQSESLFRDVATAAPCDSSRCQNLASTLLKYFWAPTKRDQKTWMPARSRSSRTSRSTGIQHFGHGGVGISSDHKQGIATARR